MMQYFRCPMTLFFPLSYFFKIINCSNLITPPIKCSPSVSKDQTVELSIIYYRGNDANILIHVHFQSLCSVRFFVTSRTATFQASLSCTISLSLLKLMPIESVMPSNHLILYHPLLLMPSMFPIIKVSPVSQLFVSGGQSIGASASVLPMNSQD